MQTMRFMMSIAKKIIQFVVGNGTATIQYIRLFITVNSHRPSSILFIIIIVIIQIRNPFINQILFGSTHPEICLVFPKIESIKKLQNPHHFQHLNIFRRNKIISRKIRENVDCPNIRMVNG